MREGLLSKYSVEMERIFTETLEEEVIPDELLTKKELAKKLRVSVRKIETRGDLPCIQWGRSVRFDWGEVVRFLKSQR